MKIHYLKIGGFKNLKDFEMDLRGNMQDIFVTIGKNGTGKSNVLEALVLIFRNMFMFEKKTIADINKETVSKSNFPLFDFTIEYECNGFEIMVLFKKTKQGIEQLSLFPEQEESTVDFVDRTYTFYVKSAKKWEEIGKSGKVEGKSYFYDKNDSNEFKYLPSYVFAYYSGISNRLEEHFDFHQKQFYDDLLKGRNKPFRPLFYARPIHSNFVLLAFYAFNMDDKVKRFLADKLNIVGFDSALFVIRKPEWKSNDGDIRFWKAKGIVATFLDRLFNQSLMPIKDKVEVRTDFRHSEKRDCWYLYLENQEKLQELAETYNSTGNGKVEFFKALESTYISDLIHETRIKVKKKNTNNSITFKELSEGEQQLLTVLGLLKFTNHAESLFLLDEPDTHLSPIWGHEYLNMLTEVADFTTEEGKQTKSQMFISTHKPTTVSGLKKEQILVFENDEKGRTLIGNPDMSAKGLTADGILTQIFEMQYTYDEDTYNQMLTRRKLFAKQLHDKENFTKEDARNLAELTTKLSDYSANYADGLFYEFVHELDKSGGLEAYRQVTLSEGEQEDRLNNARKILAELRLKRSTSK
jgi:predicted ATPase